MLSHSSHFVSEETVCIKLRSYSAQCSSICCQKCCAESHFSALKANYCHKNTKCALIPVIMYNIVTELCGKKNISKLQKKRKKKENLIFWSEILCGFSQYSVERHWCTGFLFVFLTFSFWLGLSLISHVHRPPTVQSVHCLMRILHKPGKLFSFFFFFCLGLIRSRHFVG